MANELVKIENFEISTISGGLADVVTEEMDGLGPMPFDRVKLPSGGGLAFEIPGDDPEQPESAMAITGVILDHHAANAYWREEFDGSNTPPDCSSTDGKTGIERATGEIRDCSRCPYNQFGSDGDKKACKNIHQVYILRSGNPIPLLLTLPPTSIKSMRDYIARQVVLRGLRCWQVFTNIRLKKEQNKSGITYSRAVFSKAGLLTAEQTGVVAPLAVELRKNNRAMNIQAEDFAAAADKKSSNVEFEEVEEN